MKAERSAGVAWGRTGMACYFVMVATLELAARDDMVHRVLAASAGPLEVLALCSIGFQFLTAFLFAAGHGTGVIARLWIAFLLFRALGTHSFGSGDPADHLTSALQAFSAEIAVAASLMLYLQRQDPR